jgi:hypothetical protein
MTSFALPNMAHTVTEAQKRGNAGASLFGAARAAAQQRQFWAALLRRPNSLPTLAQDHPASATGHFAGRQSVRLDDIRGSEGRSQGFDAKFYPQSDETRQRWQSVANALADGLELAPVQLIQVGGAYYVRDGHHRVSVNRALGHDIIEAEVTVWKA